MRDSTVAMALSFFVAMASAAESSIVTNRAPTDLPPQTLASALRSLALQRNFQIVFASKDVSSLRTQGAMGDLTIDEALDRILKGTGLTYCHLNDTTVEIAWRAEATACVPDRNDGYNDAAGKDSRDADGAEAGARQPFNQESQNSAVSSSTNSNQAPIKEKNLMTHRSVFARMASVFAAAFATAASAQTSPLQSGELELEEVVVTGSRLQVSGFNTPTPVTVVGSETIEQRSPANIVDVLTEQPAFQISVTDSTRNGTGISLAGVPHATQATLNLRGMGPARTLFLINGHRSVGTNWDSTVDSNIIPVGLVERVDVVTGGASAAYGSDAVAGVVNVILRNKMQGVRASAQMGMTEYSSAKQYTTSLSGGTSLFDDRLHVIGGIDYNRTDAIPDVYGKKWAQAEVGNFAPTTTQRIAGNLPQTVVSNNVEPASTAPGGLFVAANGQAYTFDANGNPVAFSRGTLSSNNQLMTGSTSNYGRNTNNINFLRLGQQRFDTLGRVSYDLTDNLNVYLEISNSRSKLLPFRTTELQQGTGFGGQNPAIVVDRNNSFVTPATLALIGNAATFNIGRVHTEFGKFGITNGTGAKQDYETTRIIAGLEGGFGDGWKWDAYVNTGRTRLEQQRNDYSYAAMQKAVNGCATPTATSPGFNANSVILLQRYEALSGKTCVPFNPFGVGRNSEAALRYVQNDTRQIQDMEMDVYAANLSGTPFTLPAGDLAVATGVEYRRMSLSADSDDVSAAGILPEGSSLSSTLVESFGRTSVKEMFAEVGVPVLKDMPGVRSLDLNGAVRFTDYELSGKVNTWKAGLTWDPVSVLRVRFTRSRDIRAPDLRSLFFKGGPGPAAQVFNTIPAGTVGLNGTVMPAGISTTTQFNPTAPGGSGNPNLKPEIADTTTAGLVFTLGGFNASVDYYKINMTDAIAGPTNQQTVNSCAAGDRTYCNFITFSAAATATGGISLLEPLLLNLNKQVVEGYDFEVAYRMPLGAGNFNVRGLLNYQPHNYSINTFLNLKTENANIIGGSPKLAYNLNLGYDVGRWNTTVQIRGFGERRGNPIVYRADGSIDPSTILGPEDAGYAARLNPSANDNTISKNRYPGQYTINPSVSFRVNENISVFGNVDNLFDVEPPELTSSSIYDLVGRRYRLGVRANY